MRLLSLLSYTSGAGAAIRTPITDFEARALPTELHQPRNSGGGGEKCTPDDLLCRQTPCCLGYRHLYTFGARKAGLEAALSTIGNVAS